MVKDDNIGQGRPTLLTAAEVAAVLQVKEGTVREHTRRGLIPCVRIGRLVRYDAADLEAYIESAKEAPRR
jgi:excisionase family DNA binding protein